MGERSIGHVGLSDEFSNDLRRADVHLVAASTIAGLDVRIAPASLILALRNPIENAINHAPRGSSIEISAESRGHDVAVCVRDQGPGVPQEELGQIRGRFVRGARERGPGTGLGLSIVQLVLSQIGGTLVLRNLGQGGFEAALLVQAELTRLGDPLDPPLVNHEPMCPAELSG